MSSQIESPGSVIGDYPAQLKKDLDGKILPGEPMLDHEGNIIPDPRNKPKPQLKDKYGQVSPIPRLAAVAAFGRPVPTAGQWAIDNMKVDPQRDLVIPPECYLYDEDRPWVLGKLNPEALGVPEPAEPIKLSQKTLDYFDALDAAYFAEMAEIKRRAEGESDEALEEKPASKKVTIITGQAGSAAPKESKSRNASVSPAAAVRGAARRPTSGRSSTSPSARVAQNVTGRPKTPKSPGRGVSPQAKIVASSGPKKVMNAKVDLEIVEKKN